MAPKYLSPAGSLAVNEPTDTGLHYCWAGSATGLFAFFLSKLRLPWLCLQEWTARVATAAHQLTAARVHLGNCRDLRLMAPQSSYMFSTL
jgi:hypothetical protein